jgi:hypothetical protein
MLLVDLLMHYCELVHDGMQRVGHLRPAIKVSALSDSELLGAA